LGWLIFLSPLGHHLSTDPKATTFVAEASLMLWLLVMGVNEQRWRERASAAQLRLNGASGMYGPPPRRKRKMRVKTIWSAPMYTAFVGARSSWP
jgi:hypothetical protein